MVARSMGNAHAVRVAKRRHCQRISKKSPALSSRQSKATRDLKSRSGHCHSGAESNEAKNLKKNVEDIVIPNEHEGSQEPH